jgi:carbamoyltransferase
VSGPRIVLGINAYHADAAAALVVDGHLVAAAEEERFRRVKHWSGFPREAIRFCLDAAGVPLARLTHVAVNTDPSATRWRRWRHIATAWRSPGLVLQRLRARRRRLSVIDELRRMGPGGDCSAALVPVEHHLAHLASAFFASPYDTALAVSVDGFGDLTSTAWGLGRASSLAVDGRIHFPHSLGIFYQAFTQYLGFPDYGDEYKVMGLAAYGSPAYVEPLGRILVCRSDGAFTLDTRYFRHHRESVTAENPDGLPRFGPLYADALPRLLGPARAPGEPLTERHRDVACSVQAIFERAYLGLLSALAERHGAQRLALAGGCAQNSSANGKILSATPLREVYVAAAAHDAGGALGAALLVANRLGPKRTAPILNAALGPRFPASAIRTVLESQGPTLSAAGCQIRAFDEPDALAEHVASRLADGEIVGWFQGAMEWGPRALGNRSILADPRRAEVREILNGKIKRRESFRPFAPSILRAQVGEWFEVDAEVPFMALALPTRSDRRARIPAVTHVDGTGRLQTVTRDHNPRFHALLEAFYRRTGVPMLLNTSFNEDEPIVCRPEEALNCFLRTEMDVVVLENVVIRRPPRPWEASSRSERRV